ncbi:MAG: hypothetical protein ACHQ7M_05675 [Chloroflexota bacterium]
MDRNPLRDVREEIESPGAAEPVRDPRVASRSALTRWVAERHMKSLPVSTGPSYERCQEKGCWGKASWSCPSCRQKSCSAHRPEHHCSLPYLPR